MEKIWLSQLLPTAHLQPRTRPRYAVGLILGGYMKHNSEVFSYDEKYILGEIRQAQYALDSAYSNFDQATEPELIDCYIYMINAATNRYKFLIKRAKMLNIKGVPDNVYQL
jgi:hypothetical protein